MVDTDIVDWMQENAFEIIQNANETYTLTWIDNQGFHMKSTAQNLRECVRGASQIKEILK